MELGPSTTNCTNCKRDIPLAAYTLHSIHCARHLVICEKCQEPIPKNSIEDHVKEEHGLTCCKICKKQIEKHLLDNHIENECLGRTLACEFCEVDCMVSQLEEHESACGSRTEQCEECSNFILIRVMKDHMKLHANGFANPFSTQNPKIESKNSNRMSEDKLAKGSKNFSSQQLDPGPNIIHQESADSGPSSVPITNNDGCMSIQKPTYRNVICQKFFNESDRNQVSNQFIGAKALPPEKNVTKTNNVHVEAVGLPCEFCQAIQDIETFDEHQVLCGSRIENCSQCNAQITGFQKSGHICRKSNIQTQDVGNKHHSWPLQERDDKNSGYEDSIPCEICGLLFPVSCIELHELSCKFSSLDTVKNNESATEAEGEPLQVNVPCSNCDIIVPPDILEIHEARCARMQSEKRTLPTVSTKPKLKAVHGSSMKVHRTENEQQKAARQNILQAAESRLDTNRKIPLSSMMVVDLPDGSQLLKKRQTDSTNVDVGHVLGRGHRNTRTNHSDVFKDNRSFQNSGAGYQNQDIYGYKNAPNSVAHHPGSQVSQTSRFRANDDTAGHESRPIDYNERRFRYSYQRNVPEQVDDDNVHRNTKYLGAKPKHRPSRH